MIDFQCLENKTIRFERQWLLLPLQWSVNFGTFQPSITINNSKKKVAMNTINVIAYAPQFQR